MENREKIRALVSGFYDIQKLRIATGNRVVQSFNIQMGQAPSTKQDDLEEETQKVIETLKNEYKRVTDAYTSKSFTADGKPKAKKSKAKNADGTVDETKVITVAANASVEKIIKQMQENNAGLQYIRSKLDYDFISTYIDLLETENKTSKLIEKEVGMHPLWDKFFKDIHGCGPAMAAICIAYLDAREARHVSSFWRYVGLDTVDVVKSDGTVVNEGRSKKKEHNREQVYTDKDGIEQVKMGLGYNPFVKTKLVGVLGTCLLKAGMRTLKDADGNPILDAQGRKQHIYIESEKPGVQCYAKIYDDYMHRLDNRVDRENLTPAHKAAMANRYMIKQFLRDLWVCWRELEGLEVSEPYEVAKLGYKPHKYNEAHEAAAVRTRKA